MMNAYDRSYLEKARIALGRMLDYAVYDLRYDLSGYWEIFLASPISTRLERRPQTNLKRRRLAVGISQSQLAEQSGVPLRTLQQYEQGKKDINKAGAEYVISLSDVLLCEPRILLENVRKEE